MELRGYCTAVREVERIIEGLVIKGKAELVKDSSKPFTLPIGKNIPAEKQLISSPNHVRIYQIYISGGKQIPIAAITRVNIRFWYDERPGINKASIKISQEGMMMLVKYAPQVLSKDMIESGLLNSPDKINM
jgi:hypothetical protein